MSSFTPKQRVKIALGGFLLFIGFVVLIFTLLVVTEKIEVANVLKPELLVSVIAVIGFLDILAGIVLLRSR